MLKVDTKEKWDKKLNMGQIEFVPKFVPDILNYLITR